MRGCYGIGLGRLLGTVVETHSDERGIIWPRELAPYEAHILALPGSDRAVAKRVFVESAKIYKKLKDEEVSVLYDDRPDAPPGQKFADADLIGARWRIVVSEKTLKAKKAEIKRRDNNEIRLVYIRSLVKELS